MSTTIDRRGRKERVLLTGLHDQGDLGFWYFDRMRGWAGLLRTEKRLSWGRIVFDHEGHEDNEGRVGDSFLIGS